MPHPSRGAIEPLRWQSSALELLDQRKLPFEQVYVCCPDAPAVAQAIRQMVIRGAPAIGMAAAYGVALAGLQAAREGRSVLEAALQATDTLEASRPTAVNLRFAMDHLRRVLRALPAQSPDVLAQRLVTEASRWLEADGAICQQLSQLGAPLLADCQGVITHCNTGALATGGMGTALGIIREAWSNGARFRVYADETRPWLQGARLTTWELLQEGIPVTLQVDSAAAVLLASGRIQAAVVGADRIAANGDVANKIGTYALAVLCHAHGVPFYVAAPTSTLDPHLADGSAIPIEQRDPQEVRAWAGRPVAPLEVEVFNPAFDVTPARLVSAIVTELGVHRPPYHGQLATAWEAGRQSLERRLALDPLT